MSRNFELLKQIEQEESWPENGSRGKFNPSTAAVPPVTADATTPRMSRGLAAEVNRLVQRVFLLPGISAPRMVTFAAAEKSPEPDWVSARAAEMLATHSRMSVCLVDLDHHNPSIHEYFGISNASGFTDALADSAQAVEFAHQVAGLELFVIPCGRAQSESERLGASDIVMRRVNELRAQFDFVLISAPPLRNTVDTLLLGRLSDGMIMVVEANSTRREMVLTAKEELNRAQVRLLGAVLNNRSFPIPQALYSRL